jgi:hypothetical protein
MIHPLTKISICYALGTSFYDHMPRMNFGFDGMSLDSTIEISFHHQDRDDRNPNAPLKYRINHFAKFPRSENTMIGFNTCPLTGRSIKAQVLSISRYASKKCKKFRSK